jgi:tetratricopeptide (TPR) repeat protein
MDMHRDELETLIRREFPAAADQDLRAFVDLLLGWLSRFEPLTQPARLTPPPEILAALRRLLGPATREFSVPLVQFGAETTIYGDLTFGDIIGGDQINLVFHPKQARRRPSSPYRPQPVWAVPPGRADLLAAYRATLAEQHLLVVCGPWGMGKTSIATALATSLPDRRLFWYDVPQQASFDGLITLLAELLAYYDAWDLRDAIDNAGDTTAQLQPDLLINLLRDQLHQSVAATEGQGPIYLICIDNAERLADDPAAARMGECLVELADQGMIDLMLIGWKQPAFLRRPAPPALSGLPADAIAELLREADLDPALAAELQQRTEGNALLVTLALKILKSSPDPQATLTNLERLQGASIKDLHDAFAHRVYAALTPAEQGVMQAVALLHAPCTAEAVSALLGPTDGPWPQFTNIAAVVSNLADEHLLRRAPTPADAAPIYDQSPLLREYGAGLIDYHVRRLWHQNAGVYFDRNGDLLRAAYHFQQCDQHEQAVRLILATVRKAGLAGRVAELHERLAATEKVLQNPDAPSWSDALAVELLVLLGRLELYAGDIALARDYFRAALQEAQAAPPGTAPTVHPAEMNELLALTLIDTSPAEALSFVTAGEQQLDASNPPALRARLALTRGQIHLSQSHFRLAQSALTEALTLLPPDRDVGRRLLHRRQAQTLYHPDLIRLELYSALARLATETGNHAAAIDAATDGLRLCEQIGEQLRRSGLLENLAIAHYNQGDWAVAMANLERALDLAERFAIRRQRRRLRYNLAQVAVNLGDYATARTQLVTLLTELHAGANPDHELTIVCLSGLADLAVREVAAAQEPDSAHAEQLAEAEAHCTDAEALIARYDLLPDRHAELERYRAEIALWRGETAAARQAVLRAAACARTMGVPVDLAQARRVRGQLLHATNRWTRAQRSFAASVAGLAAEPYERARSQLAWGAACLQRREHEAAITLLAAAQTIFRDLDAQRDLQLVEQLLHGASDDQNS